MKSSVQATTSTCNRIRRALTACLITLFWLPAHASEKHSALATALMRASDSLESHVDHESVTQSLYEQLRPRAKVTRKDLTKRQIDQRVREYVARKYVPALVGNYAHLYAQMRNAGHSFSDCARPRPIDVGDEILKCLCVRGNPQAVQVKYMTRGHSKAWEDVVIFEFSKVTTEYHLTGIDLGMSKGQQAYVDGI